MEVHPGMLKKKVTLVLINMSQVSCKSVFVCVFVCVQFEQIC